MESRPPLIGITTTDRDEALATTVWYDSVYSVPAHYVDAVRRAGGNPVLLPPGEQDWGSWLSVVDAVLVTGGADVAADIYGGDVAHPRQEKAREDRDATELALARHLIDGSIPALFVCRGIQVLNVAMGGTINQHLADSLEDDIHRGEEDGWVYHEIEMKPDSLAAEVMGTRRARGATGHHQAIDRLAPGLEPVGWAADGTIEAVEVDGPTWLVGVQWHPEVNAHEDAAQQRLFDGLVAAAREARRA
jgi:putative glutamine amidotransferase